MPTQYLFKSRPPGIGCQPDGFVPDTMEAWYPAKSHESCPTRRFFGSVEYEEPLPFERIDHYSLYPVNLLERAEMVFWREGESADWLRKNYLSQSVEDLRDFAYERDDEKARAALIILEAEAQKMKQSRGESDE